jgi:hypothetical protein
MTQDEIIEMAIEAGLIGHTPKPWSHRESVERFAALVASAEREACAKVCDNKQYVHPYHDLGTLIRARGEA